MVAPPDHSHGIAFGETTGSATCTPRNFSTTSDDTIQPTNPKHSISIPTNKKKVNSDSESEMVNVKLSPTLKHLLTLRNPHPDPGPSVEALNGVFSMTLGGLKSAINPSSTPVNVEGPGGEGLLRSWLVVTMATLLTTNTPSTMGPFYRFATLQPEASTAATASLKTKAERVAIMREAGLKCAVLTGIPKVINNLGALREALDNDVKAELDASHLPKRDASSQEATRERGAALFESIYNPHSEKLLNKLGRSHPDFPGFIIEHAYGGVLSNPSPEPNSQLSFEAPLISRTLTSALAVACLRAQGGVGPQLTSHVFGLLKAHHQGNQTPIEQWISTEEGAEWVLGTVDQLCDVVRDPNAADNAAKDSARL